MNDNNKYNYTNNKNARIAQNKKKCRAALTEEMTSNKDSRKPCSRGSAV